VGQGLGVGGGVPRRVTPTRREGEAGPARPVYFGAAHGWITTPVLNRSQLATRRTGPLIIEEYDATALVAPGAVAELDASGNILIVLGQGAGDAP
jgi:N-methylhydantoinase A